MVRYLACVAIAAALVLFAGGADLVHKGAAAAARRIPLYPPKHKPTLAVAVAADETGRARIQNDRTVRGRETREPGRPADDRTGEPAVPASWSIGRPFRRS